MFHIDCKPTSLIKADQPTDACTHACSYTHTCTRTCIRKHRHTHTHIHHSKGCDSKYLPICGGSLYVLPRVNTPVWIWNNNVARFSSCLVTACLQCWRVPLSANLSLSALFTLSIFFFKCQGQTGSLKRVFLFYFESIDGL